MKFSNISLVKPIIYFLLIKKELLSFFYLFFAFLVHQFYFYICFPPKILHLVFRYLDLINFDCCGYLYFGEKLIIMIKYRNLVSFPLFNNSITTHLADYYYVQVDLVKDIKCHRKYLKTMVSILKEESSFHYCNQLCC